MFKHSCKCMVKSKDHGDVLKLANNVLLLFFKLFFTVALIKALTYNYYDMIVAS